MVSHFTIYLLNINEEIIMSAFKQKASVRQNANQGPLLSRRRLRNRLARIGVGLFTSLLLEGGK
jgi:hypothetical protein